MTATSVLLSQLIVILLTARGCGWLLKHFGQPSVIGEMAAGVVLGPICFGALFPEWHATLFPPAAMAGLSALATLGLVLFMFVVGLEIRIDRSVRAQVMARILKERGMTHTAFGQLSLSSAAVVDLFAWGLLAVVVPCAARTVASGR